MKQFLKNIYPLGVSLGFFKKIKNYLSIALKIRYLPQLVKRDGGFKCFYCKKLLELTHFIFEHLNDNRLDNRIENIVLSCQSCNNRKTSDNDMKAIAMKKLDDNENRSSNCKRERKSENEDFSEEMPKEMKVGKDNLKITREYIYEQTANDGFITESDAIYSSAYICVEKTGFGSVVASRNYVKMLTSPAGAFKITRDKDNKKIIVRRGK